MRGYAYGCRTLPWVAEMAWQIVESGFPSGFWQKKNEYAASHAKDALNIKSIKRLKIPFLGFWLTVTSQ